MIQRRVESVQRGLSASWIDGHKGVWRLALLVAVLVSMIGPWIFDVIWVPAEYTCHSPHVRLDENYCGMPQPGTWLFRWLCAGLIDATAGVIAGTIPFGEWARVILAVLLLSLLILPVFGTLLVVLGVDRRRWRVLSAALWGVAAGMGLLMGAFNYPRLFWLLWGLWLYAASAVSMLTLEALTLAMGRDRR